MAHITDVLRKPVLTEKTMKLMQEENKYTFDVALSSNKTSLNLSGIHLMTSVRLDYGVLLVMPLVLSYVV